MEKSKTLTLHPILGCFNEANNYIGSTKWESFTDIQREFIERYVNYGIEDIFEFSEEEIKFKTDVDPKVINQWLTDNNFPDLKISGTIGPIFFYVACILHVFLKWKIKGLKCSINYNSEKYNAARMSGICNSYFKIESIPNTITRLSTKTDGESVFIVEQEEPPSDIYNFAKKIKENYDSQNYEKLYYGDIVFPFVKYKEEEDIHFLEGISNKEYVISEAIQETRFKMDNIGAEVESAAALGFSGCAPMGLMEIKKPFLVAIFREKLKLPYFIGWFNTDSWVTFSPE